MHPAKDDIAKASQQIGLTDSQAESLWQSLQDIRANKPKINFASFLIYIGSLIALLSLTWFYTGQLKSGYALLTSTAYALIFFSTSFYFWHTKKLKVPGGLLSALGIVMVPPIVYSLQNVMHWWPTPSSDHYGSFYRWAHGAWVPMEICTLLVACLVLYFVRFPFITVPIYFIISFMSMDAIDLLTDPETNHWRYYSAASIAVGTLLNVLAFVLYRKDLKDFGFWAYLFGMFLCWGGLTGWNTQTELGEFIYFSINVLFLLLAHFFHRKIFMVFGSLGVVVYMSHLAMVFSDSLMFSYILAAIGFSIMMLATFLLRSKKVPQLG